MKYFSVIFIITTLVILSACKPETKSKKGSSKEYKVTLSLSTLSGQVDVYGKSGSTGEEKKLNTVTKSPEIISVPEGSWKIYSFGKNPSDSICQNITCGISEQITILKDGQEISLTTSTSNCNNSFFSNMIKESCSVFAPTSLSLVTPATASHTETKPTIRVGGLTAGNTVQLYKDPSCVSLVTTATATSANQNITLTSPLLVGNHTFYAKQSNARGQTSACSSAKLNYSVISSSVVNFNLNNFQTSAKVYSKDLNDPSNTVNLLATTSTSSFSLSMSNGRYLLFVVQLPAGDTYCENIKCDFWSHNVTTGTTTVTTFDLYPDWCAQLAEIVTLYKSSCSAPPPPTSAILQFPSTASDVFNFADIEVTHTNAPIGELIVSRDNLCSTTAGSSATTATNTIVRAENLPGGPHRFYAKTVNMFGQSSNCAGPLASYTVLPMSYFIDATQPNPIIQLDNLAGGETVTVRANSASCANGTIIDEFTITGTGTQTKKLSWSAVLDPYKDYAVQVKQGTQTYCYPENLDVSSSLTEGIDEYDNFSSQPHFLRNGRLYSLGGAWFPSGIGQYYPYIVSNNSYHNIQGGLGLTSSSELYDTGGDTPLLEVSGKKFSHYSSLYSNICGTLTSGQTLCWGENDLGQLGNGTNTATTTAQIVQGLPSRAKQLALGSSSACAILYDGSIYCWGDNSSGQLGTGNTTDSFTATKANASARIYDQLVNVNYANCAKTIDGDVDCWGWSYGGALGQGDYLQRNNPTPITSLNGLVQKIYSSPYGERFCALLYTGELYCWGRNLNGSMGYDLVLDFPSPVLINTYADNITDVYLNQNSTCYQTDFQRVKCLGNAEYVQLGDGKIPATGTPTLANKYDQSRDPVIQLFSSGDRKASMYKTQSGKIYALGSFGNVVAFNRKEVSASGKTFQNISTNYDNITAITTSAEAYYGASSFTPITQLGAGIKEIPYFSTYQGCALYTNGAMKCWGSYDGGGGASTLAAPYTVFTSGVTQISGTGSTNFAVTSAGELYGWGYNANKELGDGTTTNRTTPRQLFASGISAISTADYMSCALKTSKEIICWGYYAGLNPILISTLPTTATKVAVSTGGACSLHTDGSVYCWGSNQYGELGQGGNYFSSTWASPAKKVPLPGTAIDISKGASHACALLSNNKLYCWGSNQYGELGIENWQGIPHYMINNPNE